MIKPSPAGPLEPFLDLLQAAAEDPAMNATLQALLSLPDGRRRGVVLTLVADLKAKHAPAPLIEAIACLFDDAVATKAVKVLGHP